MIGLLHQHGRCFIVLEHQYSCHDTMYIRSIRQRHKGDYLFQCFLGNNSSVLQITLISNDSYCVIFFTVLIISNNIFVISTVHK